MVRRYCAVILQEQNIRVLNYDFEEIVVGGAGHTDIISACRSFGGAEEQRT